MTVNHYFKVLWDNETRDYTTEMNALILLRFLKIKNHSLLSALGLFSH